MADRDAVEATLRGLGYSPTISLTKNCESYAVHEHGRDVLAAMATVPEADLSPALADLRALLADLSVHSDDLTTELYTDAVAAPRRAAGPHQA